MEEVEVNLIERIRRPNFRCDKDVYRYDYDHTKWPNTLIVDFANKHVGGGCFGDKGFVQEEQMVAQSTDFAACLYYHRPMLDWYQCVEYQGVHMDAWWPRTAAAKRQELEFSDIRACHPKPLTILAVHAPQLSKRRIAHPTLDQIGHLAVQIAFIYGVAQERQSSQVFTGLLGGGAFRNNRPLILLLHMLLQPFEGGPEVVFHHPIFQVHSHDMKDEDLESGVLTAADVMLEKLTDEMALKGQRSLFHALKAVVSWNLDSSHYDADLRTVDRSVIMMQR